MIKRIHLVLLLVASLVISSCGGDDDANDSNVSFIRANIGGVAWEATTTLNSSILQVGDEGQRYDLTAQDDDYRITLAITQSAIGDCMNFTTFTDDDNLVFLWLGLEDGTYAGLYDDDDMFGENKNFIVTVTSCGDGTISGTFSGTQYGSASDVDPATIEITNGVFQNVPFNLVEL